MTVSRDPAVLFYTSDFLGGVALMDMRERGQYITLLCLQRERGHMTEEEMKKAVGGRLSAEVRRKFVTDEEGMLFNVRMETEIQKRNAHCQKQRENINKRWNKKKASAGMNDGNTTEYTTVLPLGNGNGNGNGNRNTEGSDVEESVEGMEEDRGSGGKERDLNDPELAKVISHYQDTIDPTPSTFCAQELVSFTERFGADIVIHAIDVARDALKYRANWSYIKGILRRYAKENVQTLGDVLRNEQEFNERREDRGHTEPAAAGDRGGDRDAAWGIKSSV